MSDDPIEAFYEHQVWCGPCHDGDVCILGAAMLFGEEAPTPPRRDSDGDDAYQPFVAGLPSGPR